MSSNASGDRLERVVGLPGAVLMGLGSILGTGIFVSIGIAAGVTGPSVVVAIMLGAVVATFNGLSSAQLAASHPVSGGTYEYGYRYLNAPLGFTAGWMFLFAKSASAATAALGLAGYLLAAGETSGTLPRILLALVILGLVVAVVASGMRRSNRANAVIVSLTLMALFGFVVAGVPTALEGAPVHFSDAFEDGIGGLLHATALMFVAYTGYGRIATLGEEVREPQRTIPKAIVVTLLATMALYAAVGVVAVAAVGAPGLAEATSAAAAPLELIARGFGLPGVTWLVALGAVTAMLGVLLNLLLGLSRVLLAMSRRGDMPRYLAELHGAHASPRRAVIVIGVVIAALVLLGRVEVTWSFSAFTVLIYYALTNLAALRLPAEDRLFPRWIPVGGLLSCLGLAFWVAPEFWLAGLALIALSILWHLLARRAGSQG